MSSEIYTYISSFFTKNCECFSLLGKLFVLYLAYRIISKVWNVAKIYFLSSTLGLSIDVKSLGKWAVVTGSTDGIGKAYAEQLAKKGLNIVLISRSAEKLNSVATEIKEKYSSVETKCIVADFSQDISIYNRIKEELVGLDIGVLVNNVGMSYDCAAYLEECKDYDLKQIITINCFSVVFMTKMLLPHMVEKKKGLIINVASLSAHVPSPLLTVYSASKAFVRLFSKGIEAEYKSKGITIQCVSPSFVATKLAKIRKTSFFIPDANSFVSSALSTAGLDSDVTGCFSHELLLTGIKLIGENMTSSHFYKMSLASRAKALAKKEKKQ